MSTSLHTHSERISVHVKNSVQTFFFPSSVHDCKISSFPEVLKMIIFAATEIHLSCDFRPSLSQTRTVFPTNLEFYKSRQQTPTEQYYQIKNWPGKGSNFVSVKNNSAFSLNYNYLVLLMQKHSGPAFIHTHDVLC